MSLRSTLALTAAEESAQAVVLIAEDHEDSRDALRVLLEAVGYRVALAANGREAVEAACAVHPDLILMDMMMPEVDGFEATRALRRTAEFRQVPILAVTAMAGSRERALEAGCNDAIAKPIDMRRFLQQIHQWIRREPRVES